jgi:diguanylate cyclase (GGDEF)-like protein
MQLDVQTLSVVTVFVTALLGALLVFAGLQNRAVKAPMVWGGAYVIGAVGQGLLTTRGTTPDWISITIANELILLGASCIWAGSRMFDSRPVRPIPVLAAPGLWLAASSVPSFSADLNFRVLLVSTLMAMLTAATAEEFWRGRAEPLMSRWPTVCALLAYAATLLARIPATLLSPILQGQSIMSGISFALIAFGTLLFTVVLAFLLLNMTKERTELQHKIASLIDPLSGVPNRRAFLDGAARLQAQQRLDPEPLAVMLFDLDRFKAINDQLGHSTGDAVLQIFAAAATRTLGADVMFGRIGGEEFAAIMPAGDIGEAEAIADRVRRNFVSAAASHGNDDLKPSVSAGVTLGRDPDVPVTALLAAADQALYRAKANGRNRVECADAPAPAAPTGVERLGERRRWRRAASA